MSGLDEQHFDVALSFAGEDRAFVQQVAAALRDAGVNLFYDDYSVVETWGANLVDVFEEVYGRRSRYVVVFVSRHYVAKPWTRHERQSAQARALHQETPYILPVQLDDSALPGSPSTVGHVDGRRYGPDDIARFIMAKLDLVEAAPSEPPILGVPRTQGEVLRLLAVRPAAWDLLLYAGLLAMGKQAVEPKWRDHRLRLTRPGGRRLSNREATDRLVAATDAPLAAIANLNQTMTPEAQEPAFGIPGRPGDPEAIEHLVRTFVSAYEHLFDWAADIRSLVVSDELSALRDITARMSDNAIEEIRAFIDHVVVESERAVHQLAEPGDEDIELELRLVLTVDEAVVREHSAELKRLRRVFRNGWGD